MATEVLEEFDLSQGTLGQDLLAEDICDFLDGNTFASLTVGRCTVIPSAVIWTAAPTNVPDNTICTLAELFCNSVSLINNEILVEHLKHLAAGEITHVGLYSDYSDRLEGVELEQEAMKTSSTPRQQEKEICCNRAAE